MLFDEKVTIDIFILFAFTMSETCGKVSALFQISKKNLNAWGMVKHVAKHALKKSKIGKMCMKL